MRHVNFSGRFLRKTLEQPYKQLVFTTGYIDRNVTRLPILLCALNAILIDIRFNPTDRKPQWGKDYLKLLLKDKYRHIPSLGNRAKSESGQISIQNLNLGIRVITELKVNLVLMCSCRNENDCHRQVIAQKLRDNGTETREITDWEQALRI